MLGAGGRLLALFDQILKLDAQKSGLIVFPSDYLPFLGKFDLQRGVFLLVSLILFEKSLQRFYLLIFFGDSCLNFGDKLPLLADGNDVLLVGLQLK
jgi:hypothetical protein